MIDAEGRQKAKDAMGFISHLTHVEGRQFAGKPFKLFLWQARIIHKLFGTLKPDGFRQYRTCFIEVPKKNGKSELGAAIALKLLCADGEIGAEVYSVASDKEQAGIIFRKAAQMVRNSEELSDRLKIIDSQKRIVDYSTNSYYRVLSSDVETKHGFNPHGVIFDELHTQPNRRLWDVLTVGTDAARKQQVVFVMTTSGFDRNSIGWEVHEHATKIKNKIYDDPRFLPFIYGVPEDANWQDENEWIKANPSLGKIFDIDNLRFEFQEAKAIPAKQNEFRRLRLNQWTQQSIKAIDMDLWAENSDGQISEENLLGRRCYGGLDLASVSDFIAWVMVFPRDDDPDEIDVLSRFWCPEAMAKDIRNRYMSQYQVWARHGYLTLTQGNAVDYGFVKKQILEDAKKFNLIDLNVDRLFQGQQLSSELIQEGLTVIALGQGFLSMIAPCNEFERRLLQKKIHHGNNPVLTFCADNLMWEEGPAGHKPDKKNSQGKIDGVVALIMAIDRENRHENGPSVYSQRGVIAI